MAYARSRVIGKRRVPSVGLLAIKVVWLDGNEDYLYEGRQVARFPSRERAEEWRSFMLEGIAEDVQSINVVPFPLQPG